MFTVAFLIITLVILFPRKWFTTWNKWAVMLDAVGLAAFAIQGADYAASIKAPLIAVMMAATMTGAGGGVIRDILAGRKPMVFRSEIYALWAALAGIAVGLGVVKGGLSVFILMAVMVALRLASVHWKWQLPHSK